MREVIPFTYLLEELAKIFPIYMPKPEVYCKVFEDNRSCIAMAEGQKFSPTCRTKHIALKFHHFRKMVQQKRIRILPIRSAEQTADILTKPLPDNAFIYLRKKLNGW